MDLLTGDVVQEVSRTAEPVTLAGWTLTFDDLLKRDGKWEDGFYCLTSSSAARIAREMNEERPWLTVAHAVPARRRRSRAVSAKVESRPKNGVVDGEVVA